MPLEKLRLRGFQKHADLSIEFDPAVTVIHGPTDAGKSAILRGLRWLATNRPAGDAFRKRRAKFVSVDLRIDGRKISRRRSSRNIYKLDGAEFAAMGSRVPDEIAALLNLGDVNFQTQFDPPYWLADAPGQVSRNLNAIVDLGVIDDTLANVAAGVRSAKAKAELAAEQLQAARAEREKLAWVPDYVGKLGRLEQLQAKIDAQRNSRRALASLIEEVETAERAARTLQPRIQAGLAAVAAGERWLESAERAKGLQKAIFDLEFAIEGAAGIDEQAARAADDFKRKTKGRRCPVCQKPMT